MKPEIILRADLLDIIFENRNKEYGAYELRSHYTRRLAKSLGIIFSVVVLLVLFGLWQRSFPDAHSSKTFPPIIGTHVLSTLDLLPKEKQVAQPHHKAPVSQNLVPHISKNVDTTTMRPVAEISDGPTGENKGSGTPFQGRSTLGGSDSGGHRPGIVEVPPAENNSPLDIAEVMPEFPGGLAALQRFLSRNLKTPDSYIEQGSPSRVLVRFVVDRDGSITGVVVEQSGGNECDRKVLRVIKKMPAWKPGKQNGINVAVYFKIPVIFQAPDEN